MTVFERLALGAMGAMVMALVGVVGWWAPLDQTTAVPIGAAMIPDRPSIQTVSGPLVEDLLDFETAARSPDDAIPDAADSTDQLHGTFELLGYDLESVIDRGSHVPRIFMASLPSDLSDVREVKRRKMLFFQTILPLVLRVNDEILTNRSRLWRIRAEKRLGKRVAPEDRLWVSVMADRYKVDSGDLDQLLNRMDIVPPSLALAQAAEESGWGTSRFVREGNAIFGQWTFSDDAGLLPQDRDDGMNHRIRAFDSLLDSVRAYVRNLNTHRAYRQFRARRSTLRHQGKAIDGMTLTETLKSYSQRGEDYIDSLQVIIRVNGLGKLDKARLSDRPPAPKPTA